MSSEDLTKKLAIIKKSVEMTTKKEAKIMKSVLNVIKSKEVPYLIRDSFKISINILFAKIKICTTPVRLLIS